MNHLLLNHVHYLPPIRRLLAEFLGTFGLIVLGVGAAVVDADSGGTLGRLGVGITFGLTVTAMVLMFGPVSGAHINPAVSVGLASARAFPLLRVAPYVLAQLTGAIAGAAVLHALFPDNPGALGATIPAGDVWQSFGLEILLTFFLMYVILAVGHEKHAPLVLVAAAAGIVVGLEATFAGGISGASMNPARSFGPAVLSGEWQDHWIYWVAPILGALAAVLTHRLLRPSTPTN